LIDEHLGLSKISTTPEFVARDASEYRRFLLATYNSKDREDPYTHFFLKEGAMRESLKREYEQEKLIEKTIEHESPSIKVLEEGNQRREKLWDKIEKVLLEERIKNEDLTNLSSMLKQSVTIDYDMKSLVKSEFVYDVEPELIDSEMSDVDYLRLARRRAEAKLIKTKIIYKIN
jgi:hypothetical protein